MNKRGLSLSVRVALLYAVVASVWIAGSDALMGVLFDVKPAYTTVSVIKGLAFVAITTLLLHLVLRKILQTETEARTRAEETARQMQAVFEGANDAILIMDQERLIDCNQRALDMFQITREEFLGHTPAEFSPEYQPDGRLSSELEKLRTTNVLNGTPESFPWQHRRRDGTFFMVEVSLRSFKLGSKTLLLGLLRDITERLKAEEALRESEEKLRTLYTSMNEGLAVHELICDEGGQPVDYRILDVNPAFEAITGLSREKVVGVLASQAYGTGKPPYLEVYASVVTSGRPANFETYFAPIDKHFAVSVFSPRQGQFATVFADITQRKEAERQIVLLNQVYALLSHINEAIVRISDRQTLFEESCRIAAEYGHLQMAWIGLLDRTTNEVRPAAWAGHEDGYLTKLGSALQLTPSSQEPSVKAIREAKVVICADIAQDPSTEAWRDAALARGYRSLMALPLKQGMVTVGALVVYAKEPHYFSAIVTESLIEVATDLSFALELFERNRQREIEQQQLRLQHSALEAAANAIMITDRQGVILWVNDAFTRLAGFARTEVIGRSPRLLKSGAHSPEFYRSLWHTVVAGSVWQGSLTNRRKDGTLYDEEMTITPVRSHKGDITHFIAIKQDVTERKKLEQQFLRAQRMQSIGLLAGGLAHDLNNMLAPVLMALPLLKQGLDIETRDHIIDTLEQSVKRGANVVQQVLTFARGVEVQRVPVQLKHLVREMARIAEETFPRDISIRSNLPADLWPFLGDPTQIHQVLLNLAVNARDSMPEGGQLSFTARNVESRESRQFLGFAIPPGRYVSVSVADTGTGIRSEVLERIFEPFFTTKPAGKGTGLGLSTVLGIVKSHGGLVEVQSRLGAGSIFTVYLAAAPTEPTPENSPQKSAPHQGRGETILVVDDEASIAEVAQSILEASGYKVITARDGKQGLSKLTQPGNEIKAILTDIMMPIMDGLALIRSARQLNLQLPIIVMTGLMNHPNEEDRAAQLQELGIQHILRKPFHAEELLARLYQALRGQ